MSGDLEIIIENQELIIEQLEIMKTIYYAIGVIEITVIITLIYNFLKDWMK